jgi:threonine aldolase
MLGGAMRQSGIVAAAGIVALETMVERLSEDHDNARRLAAGLIGIDRTLVNAESIETNIVRVDISGSGWSAQQWVKALEVEGVATSDYGRSQLRFVTHRHIGAPQVEAAVAAMSRVWERACASRSRAAD